MSLSAIHSPPLLYRAAKQGVFGSVHRDRQGCIADALFVFLDGTPSPETAAAVETRYAGRPLVSLTDAWENLLRDRYPGAPMYRRYLMKPSARFRIPEAPPLPAPYRAVLMDEAAFSLHPFSHGSNYPTWEDFQAEGSGAVVYFGDEIVASASSFLSLDGEVELDVSTKEGHREKGLASACVALMLRDCMERGITVHWDAQNEISKHLAEKYGFDPETEYYVRRLPEKKNQMLRLRPYKACDAETVVSWVGDEVSFRKWCADRFETYPVTAADLNRHYEALADSDSFYEFTAFDDTGVTGHMIMRFVDAGKTVLRFGFVIVDPRIRGKGYGKGMLQLAIRYAFEILKADRITLGVFENNEPAYRCYRAAGFREVPLSEPEVYHVLNEDWACRELELSRSQWESGPEGKNDPPRKET